MPTKSKLFRAFLFAGCAAAALAPAGVAHAKKNFHIIHVFSGADGRTPYAGLIADAAGNFYGTTALGGTNHLGNVFKLAPDGTVTNLHSFSFAEGTRPESDLVADQAGNLYGTTSSGGTRNNFGTVFKLSPHGTLTVLHAFKGNQDGRKPNAGLIIDSSGNLYGTTPFGGGRKCKDQCGIVFKIAPDGTETVLHVFGPVGDPNGSIPEAGLLMDSAGNLFGTTAAGGSGFAGVVFKLAPDGTETVVHAFLGGSDGMVPWAPLIADAQGNMYGTTTWGGGTGCQDSAGCGTVFKIAPNGQESVLYAFKGGNDGYDPRAGLLLDSAGNLFGTTSFGGGVPSGCEDPQTEVDVGCGTVFKVASDGTETVLHAFSDSAHAAIPLGRLAADQVGRLYGTTSGGLPEGPGQSTVFRVIPQ